MSEDLGTSGLYLPAGTHVRYDSSQEDGPEHGIVVHCWHDDEMDVYDCYVAFFGKQYPQGKPTEIPYILRYFTRSLTVIKPAADVV